MTWAYLHLTFVFKTSKLLVSCYTNTHDYIHTYVAHVNTKSFKYCISNMKIYFSKYVIYTGYITMYMYFYLNAGDW